jgi:methylase of polypeptide subunit release factors
MPEKQDNGAECFLEFYHQEALASGSRIRERLSLAVENSIKELANGLLKNHSNEDLREKVLNNEISAKAYYLYTLRLVYRVLFLMVIEERKLIYPEKRDEELNRKRSIYYNFYSVQRLTKLAEKLIYVDPRKTDLWQSLITTFSLFEHEQYGKKLGISPLGAGIFAPNALGIISDQLIDNETLLRVLRYLVTFENEKGQRVRVNYADLDVEEFGSVYEGLLDYDPEITDNAGEPIFGFVKGDDRSSSGSHYTPEELVKPLIKHSLDYLIEDKLKEADPEKGLLSLTICDVACGSGHILLSAARRVGFELAKLRSKEDQPTPSVMRVAVRDVIRHCIYGVDLNPLAVELCKVALWLEAHEPGEPLNFLDHHIKCGNAIVGLAHADELEKGIASEAFKTLSGDEKEIASAFKKRNDQEIKTSGQLSTFDVEKVDHELKDVQADFLKFSQLPENTPEQIVNKEKAYQELSNGKKWWRLKNLADLQVAQFFIPKTTANKEKITTHAQYMTYLKQGTQIQDRGAGMAVSADKRFFHWFLEFPEVFQKGGFDCILGNPPYLGGNRISKNYGWHYSEILKHWFVVDGNSDLVVYFINRAFKLIKSQNYFAFICSQSIKEGTSRIDGLQRLLDSGGDIIFAKSDLIWPGVANTLVNLFSFKRGIFKADKYLNNIKAGFISSFLTNELNIGEPFKLSYSLNTGYVGSALHGEGFVLDIVNANRIIKENPKNSSVVLPLLIGDDFNNNVLQEASRFVIDFDDLSEDEAKEFVEVYNIAYERVKPEREKNNRKQYRDKWWQFGEKRAALRKELKQRINVVVTGKTAKHLNFIFLPTTPSIVFDQSLTILPIEDWENFSIIQSEIHLHWARKFSTTQGGTPRYNPSDTIQSFPFPQNIIRQSKQQLLFLGEAYHEQRSQLMLGLQLGLTKTYNLFHSKGITQQGVDEKDKQVQALHKHLEKTPDTISFEASIEGILKLRALHKEMDETVLKSYGWAQDDAKWGKTIALRHDFYEVDYLPENDRVRYTIHPEARKEVLKRLLLLNHERYAEEVAAGLHDKKTVKKEPKVVKAKVTDGGLFGEGEV